jgi:hypothetical protein
VTDGVGYGFLCDMVQMECGLPIRRYALPFVGEGADGLGRIGSVCEPLQGLNKPGGQYCRISNLVEAGIVGGQAASRYLKELASIGVLVEHAVGREKLFTHPRLLDLLMSETHEVERHA